MIEFEWDEHNLGHISPERGITADHCREAFEDPKALWRPAYRRAGEPRWTLVGATKVGRIIMVIYTIRVGRFRVVTAYPASGRRAEKAYREQV